MDTAATTVTKDEMTATAGQATTEITTGIRTTTGTTITGSTARKTDMRDPDPGTGKVSTTTTRTVKKLTMMTMTEDGPRHIITRRENHTPHLPQDDPPTGLQAVAAAREITDMMTTIKMWTQP